MHVAAVFVVEAHLDSLRAEAERNRYARPERSLIRRIVDAAIESLRSFSEPAIPKLDAYPYAN